MIYYVDLALKKKVILNTGGGSVREFLKPMSDTCCPLSFDTNEARSRNIILYKSNKKGHWREH